jgi:AAA+ superfamily predicted ATPase
MRTTDVLAQLTKVKRLRATKLPRAEMAQLATIAAAAKPARGKAPRRSPMLFTGERAAIAAEALAREMGLDLYRIDLAQVVSKYIGETEKNLARLFAAAGDDAILLFDEANALFGKRTDVKDAHDRYANLDVATLLQLLEGYAGLLVLASATLRPLAPAVKRRLRVFGFPPQG